MYSTFVILLKSTFLWLHKNIFLTVLKSYFATKLHNIVTCESATITSIYDVVPSVQIEIKYITVLVFPNYGHRTFTCTDLDYGDDFKLFFWNHARIDYKLMMIAQALIGRTRTACKLVCLKLTHELA